MIHLSSTLIFGYLNIKIGKPKNEEFTASQEIFMENKPDLIEEELKLCGDVISKVMILSQNPSFLIYMLENHAESKFLFRSFLKFYEKFVKVYNFL